MYSAFATWGYSKWPSSRKSSHEVSGRRREVGPLTTPQGVLLQNWGETEQNRKVTCMVLKARDNDCIKNLALSHHAFRGP
ncbi:hypothetical protein TNCV_5130891 [Trichonephila clavipes]|nr:hypothetical protein TNCV_5130891 [Trichonephila clavipes]